MDCKQRRIKAYNNLITFILGMGIVLIGYVAWGMFTIAYKSYAYELAGIILTILSAVLYVVLVVITGRKKEDVISSQLSAVSFAGFIVSVLLFWNLDNFVLTSVLTITFGGSFIYGMIVNKMPCRHILSVKTIRKYWGIILLLITTSFFVYEADAVQARWDGLLYYRTCMELDITSLSSLAVYGHIAQTYGVLIGIGNLIVGNTLFVMIGLNIILMLSSIVGFYVTLKAVLPGRMEIQYVIAAAVYAWSPFLLGMVYYHSLDFYCGCLFIWVLYALYKQKWVYFSIFSLLFCFTKEPAIIIYASACAGIVALDMMGDDEYSLGQRVKRCFARKQYYLMVLPCVLWLVTYKILGPWSAGNGEFSIDVKYVFSKVKNLYVLNFNWLFTLTAVCGGTWILIKKRERGITRRLLPVWCSQFAFTLFSCLFSTVNHPRYNDTNQVTLYLLAIIPLLCCCKKKVSGIIIGCLSILCLISSFKTCDPITKRCYDKVDIGKTEMIYTSDVPLGDGMIYNRQMLGFEVGLGNALEEALDDSQLVLFPTIGNNAYAFDGLVEVGEISEDYAVYVELWDTVNRRRAIKKTEGIEEFQTYQLTDHIDWSELKQQLPGRINYIYLPTMTDPYSRHIKENYRVLETAEYEHRGWVIGRICFTMDD